MRTGVHRPVLELEEINQINFVQAVAGWRRGVCICALTAVHHAVQEFGQMSKKK